MSEAEAETTAVPETVAPLTGEVIKVVGGVVSGAAGVAAETGTDCAEVFPAASKAATA